MYISGYIMCSVQKDISMTCEYANIAQKLLKCHFHHSHFHHRLSCGGNDNLVVEMTIIV